MAVHSSGTQRTIPTGPIRVAVAGLGIGKTHLDRYRKLPDAEIAGVSDLNPELAEQVAATYGCPHFTDLRQLLDQARPHAISLCTPPAAHPQLTALAAERGVHVLAEKPMASTVEGCQQMIDSCRRHGVTLMLGHKKRFAPPFMRLRELTTHDGPLGPIRQVTIKYMHPGMSPRDWFWDEADGGGPILENHVHAADTLGYLAGTPLRVYAEGATRFVEGRDPQPNVAAYAARFSGRSEGDGQPAAQDVIVSAGYGMIGPIPSTPLAEEQWFFGCERGAAEVTGPFDNLQRLRWAPRDRAAQLQEEHWPDADPFLAELEHFLHCIRTGQHPIASGEAGLQAVRFCLAIKESLRTTSPITFT
jgi:UDP-N-acetylglucosamine 3-dehydrogenase